MPGIFRLNNDNTLVLTPEAKELCENLSLVDYKTFLYIVLAYDTMDSPYRRMPLADRRRIARNRVFGPDKNENFDEEDPLINLAVKEMSSIVYDENQIERDVLLKKLSQLNNQLIAAEVTGIKGYLDAINLIEERIGILDGKIDMEEEKIYLRGNKRLSLVEKFIQNRERYFDKMKSYGIGQ